MTLKSKDTVITQIAKWKETESARDLPLRIVEEGVGIHDADRAFTLALLEHRGLLPQPFSGNPDALMAESCA